MCTCTREQGKLKLTILQTLHVGGVSRKLTLHHARDVREGAGKSSLSWHGVQVGPRKQRAAAQGLHVGTNPVMGEELRGEPGRAHTEVGQSLEVDGWWQWYA